LLFAIVPPTQRYPAPRNIEALHQIEEKISLLPGVESVTLSAEPLLAQTASNDDFLPDDQPATPGHHAALLNTVGQNFFATIGIPIVYGRAFDFRDTTTSPRVAIVNQALAQKEFAGMNPVGKTFKTGRETGTRLSASARTQSTQTYETILFQPSMLCTDSKRTYITA
jgi:hypothetical protein